MSSLLFKNDIHNILPSTTENSVDAINNIKINNVNYDNTNSATSSAFMNNSIFNNSTSTANMSQMGGGSFVNSATSDLNSDINNLVNMLTSESNVNSNKNNSTPISLENKLRKMLNQDGGNFSDDMNTDELEDKIYNIVKNNKQQNTTNNQKGGMDLLTGATLAAGALLVGSLLKSSDNYTATESEVNVQRLLNNNSMSNQKPYPMSNQKPYPMSNQKPYPMSNQKPYPMSNQRSMPSLSETSRNSALLSSVNTLSETSSENVFLPRSTNYGKVIDNTTTDVSDVPELLDVDSRLNQLEQQDMTGGYDDLIGGENLALVAFRTIVKNVVNKLGIKYNKALKVAAKIQADVKSSNPNISHDKLADAADSLLTKNMNQYLDFSKEISNEKKSKK